MPAADTKDRIDQAAISLFISRGVDASTTKEIAAAAGISEGAIYRHYRSKDELAVSLFMGVHKRLSSLVEEAGANAGDIKAKAAAIVAAYCEVADENWSLFTFHILTLHRFLPHYREDGRDPTVLAAMVIGVVLQTAQNTVYGRIDSRLTTHAPLMTKAVQAILFAR
jgi:AcrR family transcriptional regulator